MFIIVYKTIESYAREDHIRGNYVLWSLNLESYDFCHESVQDKLIVVTDNKEYSIEEIKKNIYFQEKHFKYKIVK